MFDPDFAKFDKADPKYNPANAVVMDPRSDPDDPAYDAKFDPFDPRNDPKNPKYDPKFAKYDKKDPKYDPKNKNAYPNDPRSNPNDPRYDPHYDPLDPRNNPKDPKYDAKFAKFDKKDSRFDPANKAAYPTDPRSNKEDPRYDPHYDPLDPRNDPKNPKYDPKFSRYDKKDPRYDPEEVKALEEARRDPDAPPPSRGEESPVRGLESAESVKELPPAVSVEEDGSETPMTGNESASMNMWGFKPSIFVTLESKFVDFLKTEIDKPKSEMYIPSVVFEMIEERKATAKVLTADSPWFGVTYKEDKPIVVEKIKSLIEQGEYPENLWG